MERGRDLVSYGGAFNNDVSNCIFDRNDGAGLGLWGVTDFTVSNSNFSRNSRNINHSGSLDHNTQIYMSGSHKVSITGGSSVVGKDDTGPDITITPDYVFSFDKGAASTNVSITGFATSGRYSATNLTGSFVAPVAVEGPEPLVGYNVVGVNDIPNTATVVSVAANPSGGQANAAQLSASVNTVAPVSAANASVKLVGCVPGRQQIVANTGVNAMQVFGANADTINGGAAGAGVSQAAGKVAAYVCTGSNNWSRLLSN